MENKIFAYMRISTNHKTQKIDRQQQTIIEYSVKNGFKIDDFFSDIITGGTKAENRPGFIDMKNRLRSGDTVIVSDVDRLGRDADDVIIEIKDLQSKGRDISISQQSSIMIQAMSSGLPRGMGKLFLSGSLSCLHQNRETAVSWYLVTVLNGWEMDEWSSFFCLG